MRISQHIRIAGLEMAVYHMSAEPWGSNAAFDSSDYNQKSLTARRQSMYHCLVRNIYKWDDQDPDVEAKAASRPGALAYASGQKSRRRHQDS